MSYLACHVQKFSSNDVKGMQIHNNRETAHSKNKTIDYSKTHLNYDALTHEKNNPKTNYSSRVDEILEKGYTATNKDGTKRAIRANTVKLVGCLVTSDGDFFRGLSSAEQEKFFDTAANYLADKFGRENVVAAKVHLDETTPHMHFMFVPLKDGKLTAKTIIDRKCLLELQNELPKVLQSAGFKIDRGMENSPLEHKDPNQYKREELKKSRNLEKIKSVLEFSKQNVQIKKSFGFFGAEHVEMDTKAYKNLEVISADYIQQVEKKDKAMQLLEKQERIAEYYQEENKKQKKRLSDYEEYLSKKVDKIRDLTKQNDILDTQNKALLKIAEKTPDFPLIFSQELKKVEQEKQYARIMNFKAPQSRFLSSTDIFYAEAQKQLKNGISVENMDYVKIAAKMLSKHSPASVQKTLELHTSLGMKKIFEVVHAAQKTQSRQRNLGLEF